MKLFFVRHGESTANLLREFSNSGAKHPLTKNGIGQAQALARRLARTVVARIYSSPVLRAVQTAQILAAELQAPLEISAALSEWSVGAYEGTTDPQGWELHRQVQEDWYYRRKLDSRMPGGESYLDIQQRFLPFIEKLVGVENHIEHTIVLVSHGGLYLAMLPAILRNIDVNFALVHNFPYTCLIEAQSSADGLVCVSWNGIEPPLAAVNYSISHPTQADAQVVLDFLIACEVAEYAEPDSDLPSLLAQWGEVDLEQDAWLVHTVDGELAGYALLMDGETRYYFDVYTHPNAYLPGLPARLLSLCERRARALAAQRPEIVAPLAVVYLPSVAAVDRQMLLAAGYHVALYHYRMQVDFDAPALPPAPQWPQDVDLRPYRPGQDENSVYALIQAAFARPDREPQSYAAWSQRMLVEELFNPELWYLAYAGEELVGAALCYDYEQYGWVRQLGVAEDWRRKGLASALLNHVFGEFYRRGQKRVALGVESRNANAYSLYEKLGMRRVREFIEYHKQLKEI